MSVKTIKVLLQGMCGTQTELQINPLDTVEILIPIVKENHKDNGSRVLFFHNGRPLNVNFTFLAQDICENSKIVYLVQKTIKNKTKQNDSYNLFPFDHIKSRFLVDMFHSYLRSNDLYYTIIDSNKDSNYYYQKLLSQMEKEDQQSKETSDELPLNINPAEAISDEPLPTLWEEKPNIKKNDTDSLES